MMCIGKVKQWCVHIAILPAQGAPRKKKKKTLEGPLGQLLEMFAKTRYHFFCVDDPQQNASQCMASRILKGKSSGVLKEYFTSPVSTSKSQSTSTSQEFTALLHDAWQTHGRA